MKSLKIVITALIMSALTASAQSPADYGKISLNVVLPESKDIPAEARALLESKLKQIVTRYGIADNGISERFVITAKTSVTQRDIAPSNPPRISQKLDVTFMIGDVVENKIYETATLALSGIGINETKAYITAFNTINAGNKIFAELTANAKAKIVEYYTVQCATIQKEARAAAAQGKYDEAIYQLAQIPDVCTECYENALALQGEIYTQKIESEGQEAFKQAQSLWAQNPTKANAAQVMSLIRRINPQVSFFAQVQPFVNQVSASVEAQQLREWEQYVREYNDRVEAARVSADRNYELSKMRINAYRDVAVEYARNQPRTVVYNRVILW